jgi:hypothetical protein
MTNENAALVPVVGDKVENEIQALVQKLDDSILWYGENSEIRGHWARRLRIAMILSGGVTLLIPSLSQIPNLGVAISPLWISVSMAVTATLFAFEKYYGNSEAWMRFILAKQELESLKDNFHLTCLKLSMATPTPPDAEKTLDEVILVSAQRHAIIQKETEKWAKVLENGMKASTPKTSG